jgi:hypothetical protein
MGDDEERNIGHGRDECEVVDRSTLPAEFTSVLDLISSGGLWGGETCSMSNETGPMAMTHHAVAAIR